MIIQGMRAKIPHHGWQSSFNEEDGATSNMKQVSPPALATGRTMTLDEL